MEELLNTYYEDNAKKLRGMVDRILAGFGGLCHKDYQDFYSLANEVFTKVLLKYDNKRPFDGFLYSCLCNKIKSEITARNRQKRKGTDKDSPVSLISMDKPVDECDFLAIGDFIPSDFTIEAALSERMDGFQDERIEEYLSHLSEIQRRILEMKMDDEPVSVIKERLGLTSKQYDRHMSAIRAYENTRYLFRDTDCKTDSVKEEIDTMGDTMTTTSEKTKNTSYAISAISKKLSRHQLRDNHVLQRSSGQWNNYYKSELIADILQGKALTQIIISEEIKDGITMYWLIDGKQRCTNIEHYLRDGFAISKNVQRYEIEYQTFKKDKNGKEVLNKDGFPIPEQKIFDIRNKKFSQLPEELRDQFLEYQIPAMLNLNCSKKEIAYDIARFNRCRPMTVAQNGWTGLDEDYAELVDNILKMDFFQADSGVSAYRESNLKSGMMRRMVVESIMAINYLDSYNKDFRKMCEYLSKEANDAVFTDFYSLIERIGSISDKRIADVFNIKDSFLWFALFDRFTRLNQEDKRFVDFVIQFKGKLHSKAVRGISFDQLNEKSTKDKSIVIGKLNCLETLMKNYFKIDIFSIPC